MSRSSGSEVVLIGNAFTIFPLSVGWIRRGSGKKMVVLHNRRRPSLKSHSEIGNNTDGSLWIMCPHCYKPNPQGRMFCQHCRGTGMQSAAVLPLAEIEQMGIAGLRRRRSRRIIRIITTTFVFIAATAVLAYWILRSYTDTLSEPRQSINSDSAPTEWSMFAHDPAHTGGTERSNAEPEGILKWTFSTEAPIASSPAVANGTVYFGSRDGKLYAIDAATGSKRWAFQTDSWVESSPAVAGGMVFVGSNDGKLYALDAATGEKLWEFQTKNFVMSSPAVAGGRIYFGSGDSHVYALETQTGTKLWSYKTAGAILASPVVVNGILYVGEMNRFFYALDAVSGKLRLRFKAYGNPMASPAASGNTIYFPTASGFLFAVEGNARNWPGEHGITRVCRYFWVELLDSPPPSWLVPPSQSGYLWGTDLGTTTLSSPAIANKSLYVGSGNKLIAFDLDRRAKKWEFKGDSTIRSSPAVTNRAVYASFEDGNVYAFEPSTGMKIWHFAAAGRITSSPAIADGTLYVGSHDGKLYAVK